MKHFKEMKPSEWFGFILASVLLTLATIFILRPDSEGFEVIIASDQGYRCDHVIPFAQDHGLARCETRSECNTICENARRSVPK